tara:strand:- start:809 stop:1258 length:450 start_codon:yes stop_codon:yes gene_type:complete
MWTNIDIMRGFARFVRRRFLFVSLLFSTFIYVFYVKEIKNEINNEERNVNVKLLAGIVSGTVGILSVLAVYKGMPDLTHDKVVKKLAYDGTHGALLALDDAHFTKKQSEHILTAFSDNPDKVQRIIGAAAKGMNPLRKQDGWFPSWFWR